MDWLQLLDWLAAAVALLAVLGALAVLFDDDGKPVHLFRWDRTLPTL